MIVVLRQRVREEVTSERKMSSEEIYECGCARDPASISLAVKCESECPIHWCIRTTVMVGSNIYGAAWNEYYVFDLPDSKAKRELDYVPWYVKNTNMQQPCENDE